MAILEKEDAQTGAIGVLMSSAKTKPEFVARRAELLAELFLQDLGATFVADPRSDNGIDFIVAFPNGEGGTNFGAVEVKATENPIGAWFPLEKKWYQRPANSNVPSLLLVVDVKRNQLYHAWPGEQQVEPKRDVRTVRVPVIPIDESVKENIRKRLSSSARRNPEAGEGAIPMMESRC